MSGKPTPRSVSSTEFKNHQGSWMDKVVEGVRLTVLRRGKRVATIEPVQQALPLVEKLTDRELLDRLVQEIALVDPQDLESLVGIAKCLNEKSPLVSASTRATDREGDIAGDVQRVAEKMDLENLERFINIVRSYVKGDLGR